mmetsp:Transcript_23819/g.67454  ORF Transcript_23819/g.67454 Transcript_23819/m.67454 type:complete len:1104 (-) Transcript_23819:34-3345(-)
MHAHQRRSNEMLQASRRRSSREPDVVTRHDAAQAPPSRALGLNSSLFVGGQKLGAQLLGGSEAGGETLRSISRLHAQRGEHGREGLVEVRRSFAAVAQQDEVGLDVVQGPCGSRSRRLDLELHIGGDSNHGHAYHAHPSLAGDSPKLCGQAPSEACTPRNALRAAEGLRIEAGHCEGGAHAADLGGGFGERGNNRLRPNHLRLFILGRRLVQPRLRLLLVGLLGTRRFLGAGHTDHGVGQPAVAALLREWRLLVGAREDGPARLRVDERQGSEAVAEPEAVAGVHHEPGGVLRQTRGRHLDGNIARGRGNMRRPAPVEQLALGICERHAVELETLGVRRREDDGGAGDRICIAVLIEEAKRYGREGWRHLHVVGVVDDVEEDGSSWQLVLLVGWHDLESGAGSHDRRDLEGDHRVGLPELEAPTVRMDAPVAGPLDLHGNLAQRQREGQGLRHVAAELLVANQKSIVGLLGVEVGDCDRAWTAGRNHGLLAIGVGVAREAGRALGEPAALDQAASRTRARGLLETIGRNTANKRPARAILVAPIDIVGRDRRLAGCSLQRERTLDKALTQICVSAPSHGASAGDRHGIIVEGDVRHGSVELSWHLTCGAAGDNGQVAGILRGHERAINFKHHLRLPGGRDRPSEGLKLEAGAGDEVHLVVLYVGFVRGRSDGHCTRVRADARIHVDELQALRRVCGRTRRLEGPSGLEGVLGVDEAAGVDKAVERSQLPGALSDDLLDLLHGELRTVHPDKGRQAGDMRRSHGGAAEVLVAAARNRRVDVRARRRDVNRFLTVARKARELAQPSRRSDGNDVVHFVVRREAPHLIVVGTLVPSRRREEQTLGRRVFDSNAHRGARAAATPRVARNLRTVRHGIIDGADGIGGTAGSRARQELQRHQPHATPRHTTNAQAVVADARDGARAMRAMHVVVHRVAVVVGEVGAVDVVNVAVLVVVDAVVRDLERVHPHLLLEILVRVVNASVDDCDGDALADLARPDVPGLRRVNVEATIILHGPQPGHLGIVTDTLSGSSLVHDGELLPAQGLRAVDGECAGFVGGEIEAEAAGNRNGAISLACDGKLCRVSDLLAGCMDVATFVGHQISAGVAP